MELRRDDAGFSLVEVMFTSVVVLAMAISTVPMFTKGLASNTAGLGSTQVANVARAEIERLLELPFQSDELTLDSGTERTTSEFFSTAENDWLPYPLPDDDNGVLWTRRTTIRQYGVAALADGLLQQAEALDASSEPQFVHMKEIEVRVAQAGSLFGTPAKLITLRTLKVK
jgi:hypothetical protein